MKEGTFDFCTFYFFDVVSLRISHLSYFTQHELSIYFVLLLHMKPLHLPTHCLFSFATFLLLIDPKRNMCSPELTSPTSSLILPHVPGMEPIFLFALVHLSMEVTSLIFVFVFIRPRPYHIRLVKQQTPQMSQHHPVR